MGALNFIFENIAIGLFVWVWMTDRRVLKLESKQVTHEDLEKLYNKIDELCNKFDNKIQNLTNTDK